MYVYVVCTSVADSAMNAAARQAAARRWHEYAHHYRAVRCSWTEMNWTEPNWTETIEKYRYILHWQDVPRFDGQDLPYLPSFFYSNIYYTSFMANEKKSFVPLLLHVLLTLVDTCDHKSGWKLGQGCPLTAWTARQTTHNRRAMCDAPRRRLLSRRAFKPICLIKNRPWWSILDDHRNTFGSFFVPVRN